MKRFRTFWEVRDCRSLETSALGRLLRRRLVCSAAWVVLALALAAGLPARAQVVPTADAGGANISAGVMGSGFYLQYGERKILGITAFVDADTRRRLGFEAEGRWLQFRIKSDPADVSAATYLIGVRYHYDIGRFQTYGKGLVGFGHFNFPYGLAQGNYLVVAPGAGVDYPLTRKLFWRVDAEYQIWPQFTFGSMSSYGVSTGVRFHVF